MFHKLRLGELKQIHRDCAAEGVIDTYDSGERMFRCALPHLIRAGGRLIAFARTYCPVFFAAKGRAYFDVMKHAYWSGKVKPPRRLRPDEIADILGVTKAQRVALDLRTIGATDYRDTDRKKNRATAKAQRKRDERRAAGVPERRKGPAEPWLAYSLSKATYYRRKKAGTLPVLGETPMAPQPETRIPEASETRTAPILPPVIKVCDPIRVSPPDRTGEPFWQVSSPLVPVEVGSNGSDGLPQEGAIADAPEPETVNATGQICLRSPSSDRATQAGSDVARPVREQPAALIRFRPKVGARPKLPTLIVTTPEPTAAPVLVVFGAEQAAQLERRRTG